MHKPAKYRDARHRWIHYDKMGALMHIYRMFRSPFFVLRQGQSDAISRAEIYSDEDLLTRVWLEMFLLNTHRSNFSGLFV